LVPKERLAEAVKGKREALEIEAVWRKEMNATAEKIALGKGPLSNAVGLDPGDWPHPTLAVRFLTGEKREIRRQLEVEVHPPEVVKRGALQFGQDRHPPGVPVRDIGRRRIKCSLDSGGQSRGGAALARLFHKRLND
jgi:hypothetical protein